MNFFSLFLSLGLTLPTNGGIFVNDIPNNNYIYNLVDRNTKGVNTQIEASINNIFIIEGDIDYFNCNYYTYNIKNTLQYTFEMENNTIIPYILNNYYNLSLGDAKHISNTTLIGLRANIKWGIATIHNDFNIGYDFINKVTLPSYSIDNRNTILSFGVGITFNLWGNSLYIGGNIVSWQEFVEVTNFKPTYIENIVDIKFESKEIGNTNLHIYIEFIHKCLHPEIPYIIVSNNINNIFYDKAIENIKIGARLKL